MALIQGTRGRMFFPEIIRLSELLLEDEDEFGRGAKRLSNVHRHVAGGRRRIEIQKALIAKLKTDGQDAGLAESILSDLVETQRIFEH